MKQTTARSAGGQVYYTTSYSPRAGTSATPTMRIWRTMSQYLAKHGLPVSAAEMVELTGIGLPEIDHHFTQEYYQQSYGFRKFASLEEWRRWAEADGLLFVPGVNGVAAAEDEIEEEA